VVRLAALAAALANQTLVTLGFEALPWGGDEAGAAVSAILTAAAAGWAWWKNNSLTKAALTADKALELIKSGALAAQEVERLLRAAPKAGKGARDVQG
jgi:SPP1 family holin